MKDYFETQTTDNTRVFIRKDHVSAVEEIPSSTRTEGYTKLYVAGYSFGVQEELKDIEKKLLIS